MIGTENEASSWWCPLARAVGNYGSDTPLAGTTNRDFTAMNGGDACNCIASRCGAWRWLDSAYQRTTVPIDQMPVAPWERDGNPGEQTTGRQRWRRPILPQTRRGYCGAFGQPGRGELEP